MCVNVFLCLGMCGSCACMIVLLHLTVLATAIRTVSGLLFQKRGIEVGSGSNVERDVRLVKLRCEASLMRTILIIPDKGEANSIIIASLLFHERMSVFFLKDTPVSVC